MLHDEAPPTKVVEDRVEVVLHCQVQYLDFEGLSDGEAMLRILSQIKPRSLVLIHGDKDDTAVRKGDTTLPLACALIVLQAAFSQRVCGGCQANRVGHPDRDALHRGCH